MTKITPAERPSIPMRAARALRRLGPLGFAWLILYNIGLVVTGRYREHRYAYDTSFDRKYGVDTAGTVAVADLDAPEELKAKAERYEVVDPEFFDFLLERAGPTLTREHLFVDLGSGKGRALLLAALAGFRRVIGVELDKGLHCISRRNIEVANWHFPTTQFTIVHGDATTFQFPRVPTLLLLNNPFDARSVEKVLANIEHSHHDEKPEFILMYMHSNHQDLIAARRGWERLDQGTFRHRRQFYAIFRWRGAESAG